MNAIIKLYKYLDSRQLRINVMVILKYGVVSRDPHTQVHIMNGYTCVIPPLTVSNVSQCMYQKSSEAIE